VVRTFLIFQREFNAIWSFFEKTNAQKILVYRGGTQTDAQKILLKRGGTQFGTFLKLVESLKDHFPKIIYIYFNIFSFNIFNFAYI
jgi:hypothetical protein